jgi:hypothetical protein
MWMAIRNKALIWEILQKRNRIGPSRCYLHCLLVALVALVSADPLPLISSRCCDALFFLRVSGFQLVTSPATLAGPRHTKLSLLPL